MKRGFTLIELLVVITIIGILITLALPNFIKAKDKANEVQVKANIYSVRLSLERYATDVDGEYPAYIWGGDIASWTQGQGYTGTMEQFIHDPLIYLQYRTSYPRNPFVRDGRSLCISVNNDPRFGCLDDPATPQVDYEGGDITGNVLSDPNFAGPSVDWTDPLFFGSLTPTGAQPQRALYFLGDDNPDTMDFVPGQMGYRSFGLDASLIRQLSIPATGGAQFFAMRIEYYALFGYGAARSRGSDVLHCVDQQKSVGQGLNRLDTWFARRPESVGGAANVCSSPDGFDPGDPNGAPGNQLWWRDPMYGSTNRAGETGIAVLPSPVLVPARGPVASGLKVEATNPDGFFDGVIVWYGAGTEEAAGQG